MPITLRGVKMPATTTTVTRAGNGGSVKTTTTRTTTTTSGGMVTPVRTGYYTTGPTYVTTTPLVTQYTTSGGSPLVCTTGVPMVSTGYRGMRVGTLSTVPWSPMTNIGQVASIGSPAPMMVGTTGTSAPMMIGSAATIQQATREAPTFSSSSSVNINGVHCEGSLEVTGQLVTRAKNVFVGIGPFVLDGTALQVTPEMAVITTHPDIKAHIADVPCAEQPHLSLAQIKALIPGHEGAVYLALPGQQAVLVDTLLPSAL